MDNDKILIFCLLIGFVLLLSTSIFILFEKTSGAKIIYYIASWTFCLVFLLLLFFPNFLAETFSYGVILIGIFMAIASLILALLGIVLLNRFDTKGTILVSMIIAFTPLFIYLVYLLN